MTAVPVIVPHRMTRDQAIALIGEFSPHCPPPWRKPDPANADRLLDFPDVMGLAISKGLILSTPVGNLASVQVGWAKTLLLDSFVRVLPDALIDAGFFPSVLLGVSPTPSGASILDQAFVSWCRRALVPRTNPQTIREKKIRALHRFKVLPQMTREHELRALSRAGRLLVHWWAKARGGRWMPPPEPRELLSLVWMSPVTRQCIYRRRDGSFAFSARGFRDILRNHGEELFGPTRFQSHGDPGRIVSSSANSHVKTVDAGAREQQIQIIRTIRLLRIRYRGDATRLAALAYLLGRFGYEERASRAVVAGRHGVTVDVLRGREPAVLRDLRRELRSLGA